MNKNISRLLLTSVILTSSFILSPQSASAFKLKDLEKGVIDVVMFDKGKGTKGVKARAIIKAPPSRVWKGITSYSKYPTYMPRVETTKVLKKIGASTFDVRIKLDTPWPLSNTWYVNRYRQDKKNWRITWKMVKGSIKYNEGKWQLKPYKGGKYTFATYDVIADPGIPLIPQWIINEVSKRTVPDIFNGIKKFIGVK